MGMTELLFQVELPDWPVAAFTRETKDAKVLMNHIRFDDDHFPTRNVFTILAPPATYRPIVAKMQEFYTNITVLREDAQALSILVEAAPDKMRFLKAPFTAALRALGPDRILRPVVIQNGWMTVSIITAAKVDVGEVIRTAGESFKKAGLNMKLIRYGEWKPEEHAMNDFEEKLTPKQVEIVKMGLALGFYDNPRKCDLSALANVFGISKAAAHNRLKAAERKILQAYFS